MSSGYVAESLRTSFFFFLSLKLAVHVFEVSFEDVAYDNTEAIGGDTDRI